MGNYKLGSYGALAHLQNNSRAHQREKKGGDTYFILKKSEYHKKKHGERNLGSAPVNNKISAIPSPNHCYVRHMLISSLRYVAFPAYATGTS